MKERGYLVGRDARPGIFRGVYLYTFPANPFTNCPNILDNVLPKPANLQKSGGKIDKAPLRV